MKQCWEQPLTFLCQFVPVFMYVCYKPETSFLSSLLHHGHFLVFYQTPHLTIKCVNKSDFLSLFWQGGRWSGAVYRFGSYRVIRNSPRLTQLEDKE